MPMDPLRGGREDKPVSAYSEVLQLFNKSAKAKKLQERFRSALEEVHNYHRALWPGQHVKMLKHKRSKAVASSQDQWFRQNTVSTSVLVSYMVFAIRCKHRRPQERLTAWEGLTKLLSPFLALGGLRLPFTRLGTGTSVELRVDVQGTVRLRDLWSNEFFQSHLRKSWQKDRDDARKPWVSGQFDGNSRVPVANVVVFLLDPQHPRSMEDLVVGPTFSLLTHLANFLDRNVENLGSAEIVSGTSRKRRMSTWMVRSQVEKAARKLWSGEEPWH